jgi:adenylate cyclase
MGIALAALKRHLRLERKLTAILCADVHGYSRLMGDDEDATFRSLSVCRKIIDGLIECHDGRVVGSAGDSVLAEFASVVHAVECAIEIQSTLKAENASLPPERRMEFRIGINLGDIIVDGKQIYGDGVNVAARLEGLAEPGGICISGSVHEQITNKLALNYHDLGEQTVKNISKPVRVFRVLTEPRDFAHSRGGKNQGPPLGKYLRRGTFGVAGLAILVGTIVLTQHLSLRSPSSSASIRPAQNPALPLPDKPSIAVLPFTNLSGDREQEYLSDGITIDLITDLSRLPDLFVIDRNSVFTYKGRAVKAADVSRDLGVKYVLEGGLQREGDLIRITTQLVDATTGDQLWAERYDCPRRDFFARQDEIVRKIVTTLNLEMDVSQRVVFVGVGGGRTSNLDAYDDYLRGQKYASSMTKEDYLKAQQMFERAIELDPKYAAAYVSLGYTLRFQWNWLWSQDPGGGSLDRAFQLAQQAIALDESLASAHGLLSAIYLSKWQFDQALGEAERAVSLDPNSADSYNALAYVLNYTGKPAEALVAAQKAMRLDPRHRDQYLIWIGLAQTQMRNYSKAIPAVKQFQVSYPNLLGSGFCFTYLIVDYIELGQEKEARAEAADLLRFSPDTSLQSLTQRFPLKDQATSDLFLADFRKAGLK